MRAAFTQGALPHTELENGNAELGGRRVPYSVPAGVLLPVSLGGGVCRWGRPLASPFCHCLAPQHSFLRHRTAVYMVTTADALAA